MSLRLRQKSVNLPAFALDISNGKWTQRLDMCKTGRNVILLPVWSTSSQRRDVASGPSLVEMVKEMLNVFHKNAVFSFFSK